MNNKKKIIIISHLIPPANTPRSNRAFELAKGFAQEKHDVEIYAVLGEYNYSSFEKEYGITIRNLGRQFFSNQASGGIKNIDYKWQKGLSILFNRALEFPDIELAYFTYKVLKKIDFEADLLITIAVPYPIHWGAAYAKNKVKSFPKVWVADCGDPYMGNPNIKRPFYFKYIEKWFCKKANFISVPVTSAISGYYPEFVNKIRVIPQGFDFSINKNLPKYEPNIKPTFIYAGAFYPKIRDPRPFLDFLTTIQKNYRFRIYTKNKKMIEPYMKELGNRIEINDYLKREKLLIELSKADFLVNFENISENQHPSKLIDYYISKRPILNIKNGEDFYSFIDFLEGNYKNRAVEVDTEAYNIKNIIRNFLNLLD